MLTGVLSDQVEAVWPEAEPWIAAACATNRGKHGPADVLARLKSREWQLWLDRDDDGDGSGALDLVAVSEIALHPSGRRTCGLLILTGRGRRRWEHGIARLEQWARAQGCAGMRCEARPGWQRVARKWGYEPTHVILEKEL